ncbi:glycosyl transferase family 1 [Vallitalea longa]|uniref:Glycosyl transferase family 1 n=1 Tax=Vallitalea longa TaxID=2936439 RepID=A0A9W6DHS1_9FIRM|nr:glycosyltransferase family 1 protein [Vallitalea longa]GKX31758.1 glycosyl transferase family 1 [Vallitalea longa]
MNDKIKILHIIGKRPRGGIGTFLLNMHSNIDVSKIQFEYLINAETPEGDFDRKVKELGGKVYVLPELRYKNTLKYLKELNHFFECHNDYKAVHVHSANIGVFNFVQAKKHGINYLIVHSHNTKYSDKKLNSIRNFFMQIPLKKMANIYFACSKKAGKFLFGKNNIDKGKVYIANNAINAEKFRYNKSIREKTRKKLGIQNKLVLGHVGRFNNQKNHDFLIDIFQKVHEVKKNSILILIGDGELENEIRLKVKRLNLEKFVYFLGIRSDVADLFQAFDLFILPSLFEGLPLVGIEAQASGLPCILSDSITDEIKITDNVEFISLSHDCNYWANKLIEITKKNIREDTYNNIVKSGYDAKFAAKKLQQFYIDL